jgi:hypothetical protein
VEIIALIVGLVLLWRWVTGASLRNQLYREEQRARRKAVR